MKQHKIILNGYPFPILKEESDQLYTELLDLLEFISLNPTAIGKYGEVIRTATIADFPMLSMLESHMDTLKGFNVI